MKISPSSVKYCYHYLSLKSLFSSFDSSFQVIIILTFSNCFYNSTKIFLSVFFNKSWVLTTLYSLLLFYELNSILLYFEFLFSWLVSFPNQLIFVILFGNYISADCNTLLSLLGRMNFKNIKSVAYSSQGGHTGQLDFCNWLADGSTTA